MRPLLAAVLVSTAVAVSAAPAAAGERIATFDPAKGEFPEGVAVDRSGAVHVSLGPTGGIRRRKNAGTWSTFARIPAGSGTGLAVLGLAADRRGRLYAAAPTDDPAWHGVVVIRPDGTMSRIPGTEAIAFPNALAFDERSNLYVTDSVAGAIWRIARDGAVSRWLQDDALEGTGALGNPFPIGANGITYARGRLFVANLEQRTVLAIGRRRSGGPGPIRVVHRYAAADEFVDGLVADVAGNLYVAVSQHHRVDRIDRHGRVRTVSDAGADLDVPVSLAFGTRGRDRRTLYVTSFGLPPFSTRLQPGLSALRLGVPGMRLPRGLC